MMKITGGKSLVILFLAFSVQIGGAESCHATDEDLAKIKKELAEIRQDLKDIKGLLTPLQPRQPSLVRSGIGTVPILGRPDAPLTLLDFSDFHCPFCGRFQENTFPKIREAYMMTS